MAGGGEKEKKKPGQCSTLAAPTNGAVTGSNSLGDTVTYSCDSGYNLVGSATRTCQADLTWSGSYSICKGICSNGYVLKGRTCYKAFHFALTWIEASAYCLEPNNGGKGVWGNPLGNEDCVIFWNHGWRNSNWNDVDCDKRTSFICERKPEENWCWLEPIAKETERRRRVSGAKGASNAMGGACSSSKAFGDERDLRVIGCQREGAKRTARQPGG
ncbi:mannose binding [Branchiostoma belcheri]|nr:mannose binding [Branchiostoma belcheri]